MGTHLNVSISTARDWESDRRPAPEGACADMWEMWAAWLSRVLRLLGLIIRAILWAASLLALLSIVGYALGLCGDGNRHYR